jgi:hypothetical protein
MGAAEPCLGLLPVFIIGKAAKNLSEKNAPTRRSGLTAFQTLFVRKFFRSLADDGNIRQAQPLPTTGGAAFMLDCFSQLPMLDLPTDRFVA